MYFNGRNDVIEPDDVIGVESISLSTNASDGRRFVTLDLEIPADMELAPIEKLMVCMPDGTTPRLFIPKQVVPVTSASASATATVGDQANEVAPTDVGAAEQNTQEVPAVGAASALPLIGG